MSIEIDLSSESALVVGGTRNIGLAVAGLLGRAGAGVCIVGATDRGALDNALDHLGDDRATGLLADVRDEAAVQRAFDHAEQVLGGPVSILVNGPGYRPHAALTDITVESWNSVLAVMLTGPFLCARELFRRLPADRRGAIVNIGGLSAYRPAKERAHVIAAKAGIAGLTRSLAEEGRGWIRANCVVPGQIETERKAGQPRPDLSGDEAYARGSCDDVARAVLSFASPQETYVTGQTVHVSGGRFMP